MFRGMFAGGWRRCAVANFIYKLRELIEELKLQVGIGQVESGRDEGRRDIQSAARIIGVIMGDEICAVGWNDGIIGQIKNG